jgi:hypothetical protein
VSTKRSISRALPALALVFAAARPLAAQQRLASGAEPPEPPTSIVVPVKEDATRDVPSDTTARFTRKDGAVGVAAGFLIPGGGQFYSAKYGKGILLLGIAVGAQVLVETSCGVESFSEDCIGNAMVGLAALFGAWGYGMLTAPGDAREYNEKRARSIVVEPVLDRRSGRTGLGLALRY